jgi:hypothetical protein
MSFSGRFEEKAGSQTLLAPTKAGGGEARAPQRAALNVTLKCGGLGGGARNQEPGLKNLQVGGEEKAEQKHVGAKVYATCQDVGRREEKNRRT